MSNKKRRNLQPQAKPVATPAPQVGQRPIAQSVAQNFPQHQIAGIKTTSYQGPIPHPDILKGFDALVPGTAKELIDLAKSESVHRRDLESKALEANIFAQKKQLEIAEYQNKVVFRTDISGQTLGAITSIICVAASTYLVVSGHERAAMILASIPISAIVKSFMPEKFKFWKK